MEKIYFRKAVLSFVLMMLISFSALSQQTLWVGQTYRFDVTSSVLGLTANVSWSTSGGYISLNGSGFYRDITVTQYFSGTATVTCEWDYKLTGNGKYTHVKRQVTITCRDNKVSISPTTLNMVPGQTQYVSYRHQYDNQYTSAANAYYQSSDPSICTVSQSGQVTAIKPGTTYINVYSKVSSVSPYCVVTVKKVEPTSISIPSELSMQSGETKTLTPTFYPSNAQAFLTWTSSDTRVVEVKSGECTALKDGTAIITVKTDNNLSAKCQISVSKGKLKLSANLSSGWVEKDSKVILSSNQSRATIYYTLDDTNPTTSSGIFNEPINIDKNITIKAFASKDGFYDSDIETFKYKIRDLVIQEYFPENDNSVNIYSIPFVSYNSRLTKSSKFDDISIIDSNGDAIPCHPIIYENQIFVVPLNALTSYKGYKVTIPQDAFISEQNESNKQFTYNFNTGSKIVKISYGDENAAIIKSDGSLWLWGQNRFGQLGNGTSHSTIINEPFKLLDDISSVDLGFQSGMALTYDGNVLTWGRNDSGNIGNGNTKNQLTPVQILSNVKKIYMGERTCAAIKNDGSLFMWGGNYHGQLGDGTTTNATRPKKILSNIVDIAVRYYHAAAVSENGTLYSWGLNCHKETFPYHTYGNGVEIRTPYRWSGYSASAVATTEGNTIFLDGETVSICGINFNGIFGNGLTDRYVAQGIIKPLTNVKEIKSAQYYVMALDNNNTLWGWGKNNKGQIGVGGTKDISKPAKILEDVVYFTTGYESAAAILSNGDVYAWGNNEENQLLGKTTSSYSTTPIKIFDGPVEKVAESVRLIGSSVLIGIGETTVVAPMVTPDDAIISSIKWTSSNEEIATVNERGIVTGISEGTVDISAAIESLNGNSWNCSREIMVSKNAGIYDLYSGSCIDISIDSKIVTINSLNTIGTVNVYSIEGIRMFHETTDNKTVSFEITTPGIYLVAIGKHVRKIVVR